MLKTCSEIGDDGKEEFVRIGELRQLFGITRPTAYLLAKEGRIQAFSLRQPGQIRGARLVSVPSVRAYLQKCFPDMGAKSRHNSIPT